MKRVTTEDLNEDLDNGNDVEPIETPEVDIPDEQLPAAAVDVTADLESENKDVDDISSGMDDAIDAQSQIAELKQSVEENGEDGRSMSATEELAVNVAMESIHSSLGLKWEPLTLESVSYRKRRETVVATLEASVGNIADKIVEGFKRAMNAVIDFLVNLLRNNWVLKKYIESMSKKVKALKGDQPTEEFMPESATALSIDGKADFETAKEMYDTAMGSLKVTAAAIDFANSLNFKYSDYQSSGVSGEFDPGSFLPRRKSEEGRYSGYLVNGRAYQLNDYLAKRMGADKMYADIKVVGEIAPEAKVLSKQEMLSTVKMADDIVDEIKRAESKKSTIKNIISRVTQFVSGVFAAYGSMVSKAAKEYQANIDRIMGVRRLINSVVSRLPLEAFKTAKALTDYVRHSLKYYKSAEA